MNTQIIREALNELDTARRWHTSDTARVTELEDALASARAIAAGSAANVSHAEAQLRTVLIAALGPTNRDERRAALIAACEPSLREGCDCGPDLCDGCFLEDRSEDEDAYADYDYAYDVD